MLYLQVIETTATGEKTTGHVPILTEEQSLKVSEDLGPHLQAMPGPRANHPHLVASSQSY